MILQAENLQVRYRNGALGVVDVSFCVDEGELVVISGPNGAGKTTSVRAVSGFLGSEGARVVKGRVTLFGRESTNLEPWQTTAMGVAFVPERRKIFPNMTVKENLDAIGIRPSRARRKVITEQINALFPVLGGRQNEAAGRLSGGQQQMLAIARSLLCEARILIVDEVTLGLHHSLHEPLFDALSHVASTGTGVIVVDEGSIKALSIADHYYVLEAGHVDDHGGNPSVNSTEPLSGRALEEA
jgi:branched-chain amino acid transport system ATP-binding protein